MNVVKEAQNPPSACGARGKSAGVKQIVAAMHGQLAALLFDGTEARIVETPAALVGGQEIGEETLYTGRVAAHNGMEPPDTGGCGQFAVDATELVAIGLVGDVFVQAAATLTLGEEKFEVGGWDRDWRSRKVEHSARLKVDAPVAGLQAVLHGVPESFKGDGVDRHG
jgi:hypothetical protein